MNLNFSKIMFLNTIMIGVMMAVSSNNWISLWTSMEIGVLSIVPMMTQEKTSSDSPIKYFIIQSISSCLMISSMMSMMSLVNFKILMTQAMMIKIGAAPFHMWMLSIIEGIEYNIILMLFTMMKIPGFISLSMLNEQMKYWSIMSMIVGAIMVINQSSVKKMLSFSSIHNLGMMMSSMNEYKIWMTYLLVYSTMLTLIILTVNKYKMNYLNQIVLNEKNLMLKTSLWISLMSMAGVPPMMGFSIKMMILEVTIYKIEILLTLTMIITSLFMMFMYMRMSMLSTMMFSTCLKWKVLKKSNINLKLMMTNILLTPLILTLKSLY